MELNMRIVEYAQVIIDDANMLLREESSLSERQRKLASNIPARAERLILLYAHFPSGLGFENRLDPFRRTLNGVFYDAKETITGILACCVIIENHLKTPPISEKDAETFLHIKHYYNLIDDEIQKSGKDLNKWYKRIVDC